MFDKNSQYQVIKEAHTGKSITELWNELNICKRHISLGLVSEYDTSDFRKEYDVLSDLIREKSALDRQLLYTELNYIAREEYENKGDFRKALDDILFFKKHFLKDIGCSDILDVDIDIDYLDDL